MALKGSKRLAQVWAKLLAEGIEEKIRTKLQERGTSDPSAIFPLNLTLPATSPGKGIRMCQEVNLAKNQADDKIHLEKERIRLESEARVAKGLEPVMYSIPTPLKWVLKHKTSAADPTLVDFYIEAPTGRKRARDSKMLGVALDFLASVEAQAPAPSPKADPFAEYMEVVDPAPQAPVPPAVDPQENLLASLYGTTQEGKKL